MIAVTYKSLSLQSLSHRSNRISKFKVVGHLTKTGRLWEWLQGELWLFTVVSTIMYKRLKNWKILWFMYLSYWMWGLLLICLINVGKQYPIFQTDFSSSCFFYPSQVLIGDGTACQSFASLSPMQRKFKTINKQLMLTEVVHEVFNPFTPKSDLIDFTLSNTRQFYSSKGPLVPGSARLKNPRWRPNTERKGFSAMKPPVTTCKQAIPRVT